MKTILSIIFMCAMLPSKLMAQTVTGKSNTVMVDYAPVVLVTEKENKEGLGIVGKPRYLALIIGVSSYQYAGPKLPNLEQPVVDATKIQELLTTKYSFNSEDVVLLKNPNREEIINELDKLTQNSTDRDNVLVFYAGHGFYDKKTDFGFWLPANAKVESRSDWIANSTIKDYVSAIPSKHTFLITDACFGGSIFKTRAVGSAEVRKFYEIYKDKSRKAMTSGNLAEVPDKSFFLQQLVKVLSENEQEFLPAASIYSRLYEPVMNNTPTVPQFGVIQGAGDEGGDFIFIKRN